MEICSVLLRGVLYCAEEYCAVERRDNHRFVSCLHALILTLRNSDTPLCINCTGLESTFAAQHCFSLNLYSLSVFYCTISVLMLHWGRQCFIWLSLRTVGASCSDSLDWAFTDTLLAEPHCCFRSTLHNQIDFKQQTEFKLGAVQIFAATAYYPGQNIVSAGKIKKELRSESNLATHHVLLLNQNLGQRIGSGRSSKIFSGFEKAEPIDK